MNIHDRDETFEELAARGILTIFGMIRGSTIEYVYKALAIAEATQQANWLEVRIQSNGGDVEAGLTIYDMLKSSAIECRRGIVTGRAHSMAAVILQACKERIALRHATLCIHCLTRHEIPLSVLRDPKQLQQVIDACEKDQARIDAILAGRSGRSTEEIRQREDQDLPMTTEEALAFGLIDNISEDLSEL